MSAPTLHSSANIRSLHPGETGYHYEIWIYSLTYGFRCFEVFRDSIREIPKLALNGPTLSRAKGAA